MRTYAQKNTDGQQGHFVIAQKYPQDMKLKTLIIILQEINPHIPDRHIVYELLFIVTDLKSIINLTQQIDIFTV